MSEQFFGKYTGLVKGNRDDDTLGRLQVAVPAVFAPDETVEARAALPYGVFFVPEENTKVWVEFEGGDSTLPIWTGVQYGPGEFAPEAAKSPPTVRAVKTASGHLLVFDDTGGSEAIVITDGAHQHVVRLDNDGITIAHGSDSHKIAIGSSEITIAHGSASHAIAIGSSGISVKHGGGQNQVTVEAATVTAKTASATVELGPAGVTVSGPLIKLGTAAAPVVRAGIDMGIGNLGAPVVMTPGQVTVLA
jgi:Type VI secretion system/phage-baseplate injector OB domain